MVKKKTILCVIGTRPEAVKMAPVIRKLRELKWIKLRILATAQHRDMLDQMLLIFNIKPDIDLNIMKQNQTLHHLTAHLSLALGKILKREKPDLVMAQGDTTTVFIASLICFYYKIPFAHIEAGLRTRRIYSPFPEEMNRSLIGKLACLHFAPTELSRNNLIKENVEKNSIHITGNTVIDSLYFIIKHHYQKNINILPGKRLILTTAHRRENFGKGIIGICKALKTIADNNNDVQILYPVHPNPNIRDAVKENIGNHPRILLCNPLDYRVFVSTMKQSYLILTDSGGIQEEAPAFGVPVLVLRDSTERPEAVKLGVSRLVGTNYQNISRNVQKLLDDKNTYQKMAKQTSPFGDGKASDRIVSILIDYFRGHRNSI